jgi:hypothetical protein
MNIFPILRDFPRYDAEWPENGPFGTMSVAKARLGAIWGLTEARKWPKFGVFGIGPLIGIHTGPLLYNRLGDA